MPTPTDPNQAQAWVTGEPPDQTVDFYIPRGNTGVMGPVGPQGPSLVVGSIETNMGPAAPGTIGATGLTGPKGDPGGFTAGTILGTADLNTIITPGIYRQTDTSGTGSLVNNYPYASAYGSMLVLVTNGDDIEQIFYPQFYASSIDGRTFYRRNKSLGVWNPWRAYNSTRVDQTAGRVIYQWDDLNNRDQLIYGDTGWRDVTSLFPVGKVTAGTVWIRRIGYQLHLSFNDTTFGGQSSIGNITLNLPSGFRFTTPFPGIAFAMAGGQSNSYHIRIDNGYPGLVLQQVSSGTWLRSEHCWATDDPWPTTLPGTAVGSIPNT